MEEWDLVGGALVRTEHRDQRRMMKTPDIFLRQPRCSQLEHRVCVG